MASDEYIRASGAQQTGLRSFIVYSALPAGCIAHEVEGNRSEPHLRHAEFAVIDPTDTAPMPGELFLIRFGSGRQSIVELGCRDLVTSDGEAMVGWTAYWQMEMVSGAGEVLRSGSWGDGPYREPDIAAKLIGRVVGILEPDFRKMLGR